MGVISSIVVLRRGYFNTHGYTDREETHQKMVAEHLNFILSAIEKHFYFSFKQFDFYSK
jgi:hypothetical protein